MAVNFEFSANHRPPSTIEMALSASGSKAQTVMALIQSRWLRLTRSSLPSQRSVRRDSLLRYFSASTPKFQVAGASGNSPSGSKRFRQHVNPLSMVYRQPVELPDWTECFKDTSLPIHLDIGCARGKYLMDVAESQASERNFVGVEIRRNVLEEAKREAERRGLRNLALVHANMNLHQQTLLQSLPGPVKSVSIFHPDPWMKKRHIKRRLVTEEFVEVMATNLPNGTPVFVQTDVGELFEYMMEIFEISRLYDFDALHSNPLGIPTDREKFVFNDGGDIYRVKFIVDKPDKAPSDA